MPCKRPIQLHLLQTDMMPIAKCSFGRLPLATLLVLTCCLVDFGPLHGVQLRSKPSEDYDGEVKSHKRLQAGATGSGDSRPGDVCRTEDCRAAARLIWQNLDPKTDPCDDFYQFACGNAKYSPDRDLKSHIESRIRELILDDERFPTNNNNMQRMRIFYNSCANTALIKSRGVQPLRSILDSLGEFPMLKEISDWQGDASFDWIELTTKIRIAGLKFDQFFEISVDVDSQETSRNLIYINMRDPLERRNTKRQRRAYMSLLEKLYPKMSLIDQRLVEDRVAEMLKFSSQLSRYEPNDEPSGDDNWDDSYNVMTMEQLEKLGPNTDWRRLFRGVLGQNVQLNRPVVVVAPNYLIRTDRLLAKTNPEVLANFIFLNLIEDLDGLVSLHRVGEFEASESDCIDLVRQKLDFALSAEYVRHFFSPEARASAIEMVRYLKRMVKILIDEADWMYPETKLFAKNKADAMIEHVGYPDELLDDNNLDRVYAGLHLDERKFVENLLSLDRVSVDREFAKLDKSGKADTWEAFRMAFTINAYYFPFMNSINILPAHLQGFYFNETRPKYVNFASIGTIIAHEITHGFDTTGSYYDARGDLRAWWDPDTWAEYQKRAQCLVEQYDEAKLQIQATAVDSDSIKASHTSSSSNKPSVTLVDWHVDGARTLAENIADNGGFELAYRAYERWIEDRAQEPALPGLPNNRKQLFWLIAANNWCEARQRPEQIASKHQDDVHSPNMFRVNYSFANLRQFNEDFGCPLGSPMNPHRKCSVW